MEEWGRPATTNDWVFPDKQIGSDGPFNPFTPSALIYRLRKILTRAGLNAGAYRFHDLRSTFAINATRAGLDTSEVQVLLGHETVIMTLRYKQHIKDELAGNSLRNVSNQMLPSLQSGCQSGPKLVVNQ